MPQKKRSNFALGYTEALNNAWQEIDKALHAGGSDTDVLDALLVWIGDNSGPNDASHEAASVVHGRQIRRAVDAADALEKTKAVVHCKNCGQRIEPDDGGAIWYHADSAGMPCDPEGEQSRDRMAEPGEILL